MLITGIGVLFLFHTNYHELNMNYPKINLMRMIIRKDVIVTPTRSLSASFALHCG
jgi:hypothetical protein